MPKFHPRPTLAVILALAFVTLPQLVSVGMFFDGAIYASISRNLAEGIGSPWNPQFSETLFAEFREHPPLMFVLQSQYFTFLGDLFLTERLYDLTMMLAALAVIWALWKHVLFRQKAQELTPYFWTVILALMTVTKWTWGYRHNVIESTLTVFCLLSTLAILHSVHSRTSRLTIIASAIAAGFAFMAFLTKGLVSLFLITVPAIACLIYDAGFKKLAYIYISMLLTAVMLVLLTFTAFPESRGYMAQYFENQIVGRVASGSFQWGIIVELLKSIAPMLLIVSIAKYVVRRKTSRQTSVPYRAILLFSLIGAAASLPLLLADMDSAHYLLPSIPFYALSFALYFSATLTATGPDKVGSLVRKPGSIFMATYGLLLLGLVFVTVNNYGSVRRDESHHLFLSAVCDYFGDCSGLILGTSAELWRDWTMHGVAQRHYQMSIADDSSMAFQIAPRSADANNEDLLGSSNSTPWVLIKSTAPTIDS